MTVTKLDVDAAFANKGSKAAVFRPRFGQAHQQYFTPRWLCQACADIAEGLFDVLRRIDGLRAVSAEWDGQGPVVVVVTQE